jgi:hypothetical protein
MDKDEAMRGVVRVSHLSRETKVNENGFHYEQVNCELTMKLDKVSMSSVRYIFYENHVKYTIIYSNDNRYFSKQYIQSIVDKINFH